MEVRNDKSGAVSAVLGAASLKWGEAAKGGFQILPDVLLRNQAVLGLNAVEMVTLINLTMHWWYQDQHPYPRSTTIAQRMGVDVRTIQRALARLAELGLIERMKVTDQAGESSQINLSGLVAKLDKIVRDDPSYQFRTQSVSPTERSGDHTQSGN
jgi:hypothetical protein